MTDLEIKLEARWAVCNAIISVFGIYAPKSSLMNEIHQLTKEFEYEKNHVSTSCR